MSYNFQLMVKPYLVGITGGSGTGKTYFLNKLLEYVGSKNVTLISQDNYYKPKNEQPKDANGIENFDSPESIDSDQFAKDISSLIEGKTVEKQEYTYNNPNKKPKTFIFKPNPVIIIEGIFVFHFKKIDQLFDLKIFIDAKPVLKLKRRILRDNVERGYTLEDVLYRYEKHVMPSYERYIEQHKHLADFTIYNNREHIINAVDVIGTFLKVKQGGLQ